MPPGHAVCPPRRLGELSETGVTSRQARRANKEDRDEAQWRCRPEPNAPAVNGKRDWGAVDD
jgi:hypothetical protein